MANISDLKPDKRNARRHNPRNVGMVEHSIQTNGFGRSMLLDAASTILAGNATYEAAVSAGLEDVQIVDSDGTKIIAIRRTDVQPGSKQALELAVADNRAAELAEWEPGVLEELSAEIDMAPFFYDEELQAIIDSEITITEGLTDPDDVPEVPAEPTTKPGDLWLLGRHRLLCGDSTVVTDVERLMDGAKADMVFTDPPYGVDYQGGHFHSGNVNIVRKRERLANDRVDIYSDVLPIIAQYADGPCYIWFADRTGEPVYSGLSDSGFEIHALIIWHKINATYAAMNAQYKQRHECCIYVKPKGSTLRWVGPTNECTVWEMKRDSVNSFHPTQKPVELAERAINNHDAQTVLDLFGGSGSTLIACEETNRSCRMMELDPRYCDVIVKRWELFTGQTATLAGAS